MHSEGHGMGCNALGIQLTASNQSETQTICMGMGMSQWLARVARFSAWVGGRPHTGLDRRRGTRKTKAIPSEPSARSCITAALDFSGSFLLCGEMPQLAGYDERRHTVDLEHAYTTSQQKAPLWWHAQYLKAKASRGTIPARAHARKH